jgi:hypothetical protein
VLVKITRNMSFKFYPDFIPIYRYMVSGFGCQVSGVSVQRRRWPEKRSVKSKKKLMNVEHPPAMHSALS